MSALTNLEVYVSRKQKLRQKSTLLAGVFKACPVIIVAIRPAPPPFMLLLSQITSI
jgi:hypothetical protein